jgi:glutamine amidotransferase
MRTTIRRINGYREQVNANSSVFSRYSSLADIRPASLFYCQQGGNVIVSSEPLTEERSQWTKVERNTLVLIENNKVFCEHLL